MNNKSFIITYSRDIRDKLKTLGFQEVLTTNVDVYTFVNDIKIPFSKDIDINKIRYSDKLFF